MKNVKICGAVCNRFYIFPIRKAGKLSRKGNNKNKKNSPLITALFIILIIAALGMIAAGIYFVFFKNRDAFIRQETEEELADEYIDDMILKLTDPQAYEERVNKRRQQRESEAAAKGSDSAAGTEEAASEAAGVSPSDNFNYEDNTYYTRDGVTYTPDYAQGVIDCVLEVPTAGIRRGVYTGTWDEINYDLDIWMVTAARPDYVLGQTHYCIYGHNHTVQNLSFNKLQKVQVGEYFYLTAESGRYTYQITNVFAVDRDSATTDYVNNFNIGADKCYLITCGRDDGVRNFRYLDLVVEGTLTEHISLEEYAAQRSTEQAQ